MEDWIMEIKGKFSCFFLVLVRFSLRHDFDKLFNIQISLIFFQIISSGRCESFKAFFVAIQIWTFFKNLNWIFNKKKFDTS
jgi:hypothetical protein